MARKPLDGTVAENTLAWGVGGLNIDASRIAGRVQKAAANNFVFTPGGQVDDGYVKGTGAHFHEEGRWPANVIFDEDSAVVVDSQSGIVKGGTWNNTDGARHFNNNGKPTHYETKKIDKSEGGASRFFYVAKASKRDRAEGLDFDNSHPTVKPTALMRYLIKLVTPEGGVVLDPFTGSGSTGKAALLDGFQFVGVELTEEYLPIIEGRLRWASEKVEDDGTLF
jgi:site-specific DNA-methyltransferase (adenine-specific)